MVVPKPVLNVNVDDDMPMYPNEILQYAPISCPSLVTDEQSNAASQDLETIINRSETEISSGNDTGLLKSLPTEENLGMDNLPSSITSFSLNFDEQIDRLLQEWKPDFEDILLQPSSKSQQSSQINAPIPSKLQIGGLFDIPLPSLKFQSAGQEQANRYAEQQLNRTYAVELNPNEKLGDFRLRVPDMAIEVQISFCGEV